MQSFGFRFLDRCKGLGSAQWKGKDFWGERLLNRGPRLHRAEEAWGLAFLVWASCYAYKIRGRGFHHGEGSGACAAHAAQGCLWLFAFIACLGLGFRA